jgi:rare lipoprotein A
MRSSIFILALTPALLTALPTEASSRGFAWFFAHSRPEGSCSGQHVVAAFYSSGSRTASGQPFNAAGHTAAHRTLPFGSEVTVTNPRNGKSVTVTINDRGPFTHGVTLDLASGAAHAIGMSGTQWVCML